MILTAGAGVEVSCPDAHPCVDGLQKGVEVGQAGTDDANVQFEPRPDPDVNKIRCINLKSDTGAGLSKKKICSDWM